MIEQIAYLLFLKWLNDQEGPEELKAVGGEAARKTLLPQKSRISKAGALRFHSRHLPADNQFTDPCGDGFVARDIGDSVPD